MASRRFRARATVGTMAAATERRLQYLERRPGPRRIREQAITTDLIYRNAVITETIAPLAVTNTEIGDSAVSNRTIQTDAIDARVIVAGAISTDELAANAVVAGKISANAITAREISANAIIAGKISADAITAREISANAITASEVSANAIVAGKIAANAVTATTIAAGSISADKIVAGGITANVLTSGTINASVISVTNINASNITAGTLTGRTVRTSAGGTRVELSNANRLLFYEGGGEVARIVPNSSPGALFNSGSAAVQLFSGFYASVGVGSPQFAVSNGVCLVTANARAQGTLEVTGRTDINGSFFANGAGRVVGNFYNNVLAGSTVNVQVNSQGRFIRGGASDARLKKDVTETLPGLTAVNKLRPVSFKWNEAAQDMGIGTRYGLIAQEVQQVLKDLGAPEDLALVTHDPRLDRDIAQTDDTSGIRHIDYTQLIPILVKAVQELSSRVEELEEKDK